MDTKACIDISSINIFPGLIMLTTFNSKMVLWTRIILSMNNFLAASSHILRANDQRQGAWLKGASIPLLYKIQYTTSLTVVILLIIGNNECSGYFRFSVLPEFARTWCCVLLASSRGASGYFSTLDQQPGKRFLFVSSGTGWLYWKKKRQEKKNVFQFVVK